MPPGDPGPGPTRCRGSLPLAGSWWPSAHQLGQVRVVVVVVAILDDCHIGRGRHVVAGSLPKQVQLRRLMPSYATVDSCPVHVCTPCVAATEAPCLDSLLPSQCPRWFHLTLLKVHHPRPPREEGP